ncbi:unnamed protein product, partial [Lepidochelys kempii]
MAGALLDPHKLVPTPFEGQHFDPLRLLQPDRALQHAGRVQPEGPLQAGGRWEHEPAQPRRPRAQDHPETAALRAPAWPGV